MSSREDKKDSQLITLQQQIQQERADWVVAKSTYEEQIQKAVAEKDKVKAKSKKVYLKHQKINKHRLKKRFNLYQKSSVLLNLQ